MKLRNAAARILSLCVLALAAPAVAQQAYPIKPIRFIVPFPPGGSTDPVARLISQRLAESLGQPVLVENRPGGNTIIGNDAVAKALPDGYTILLISSNLVINPHLFPSLPYDAFKDFAPVATLVGAEFLLVVHPSIPANNLQDFIAFAKTKPGQLNYATSGSGGLQNLAGELFNIMAGVKTQHVPYKGGGPAITDLVGGQVQLAYNNVLTVMPFIKTGKLKPIAISGDKRSSVLPQVPTFTQAGLPGFSAKQWFAIAVPARTPKGVIDKLSTEINRILARPDTIEKLASQGVDPFISTPEQVAALMKSEYDKYGKIIKAANIQPQ